MIDELVRRPMEESDKGYVVSTWMTTAIRNLRLATRHHDVSIEVAAMNLRPFLHNMVNTIECAIFTTVREPAVIHAWCAYGKTMRPDAIHWAYVPFRMRGLGVGKHVVTNVIGAWPDKVLVTSSPINPRFRGGRFEFCPYAIRLQ